MVRQSSRLKSIYTSSPVNKESSSEQGEDEQVKVIYKSTSVRSRRGSKFKNLNEIQTPASKKVKVNKNQESSVDINESQGLKNCSNKIQQLDGDDSALKDWRPKHVVICFAKPKGRPRKYARLSTPVASSSPYIPRTEVDIFCPWIQVPNDELPELILPESSNDLLLPNELLFDAVEIYETYFNFYRFLSLSPFLFEEFCASLCSPTQSLLLAEIHIAFIRLFFYDAEHFKITFGLSDNKHNLDIMLEFLDGMNYAELLRQHAKSDYRFKAQHIIDILENNYYSFVDVSKRVQVLRWLCLHLTNLEIINSLFTHQTVIEVMNGHNDENVPPAEAPQQAYRSWQQRLRAELVF